MNDTVKVKWIAGFWRRSGTLLFDIACLALVGFILGLFLEEFFIGLVPWGLLVGFSIALFYFGLLNSKIANGKTLGKFVFKIRVVDSDDETIGIFKSCLRYSILSIPFFLNGAPLPEVTTTSF